MTICTTCGNHTPETVTRGPLAVQRDPPAAYWRGKSFDLTGYQTAIMHALCHRGEIANEGLEQVGAGRDAYRAASKLQIHRIRQVLPAGLDIRTIHGWGYRLVMEK